MSIPRVAVFLSIVLSIWTAMHLYVFWRLGSVPWVAAHLSRRGLFLVALVLWSTYILARLLDSWNLQFVAWGLEYLGALWIGTLFLLLCALLLCDLATLGGWLFPTVVPSVRGWAVIGAGLLALWGIVTALRAPVVRDYEVRLAQLPPERDGTVLVQISDLHLGTLIGRRWMVRLVERLETMRPDLVVIVGDLVDGNIGRVESLRPVLERVRAPLGVWAVTGNHEYYAGVNRCARLFEAAGYHLLRDNSAEVAPGLVLTGIDDLTARAQYRVEDNAVARALAHRPAGAAILLSHTPWEAEQAAAAGAGLMLCGHTHNGQIWPFYYIVGLRYPFMGGRYQVGQMPLIVCRGTGTWGPRMRLWYPSEIVRVTLRTAG